MKVVITIIEGIQTFRSRLKEEMWNVFTKITQLHELLGKNKEISKNIGFKSEDLSQFLAPSTES